MVLRLPIDNPFFVIGLASIVTMVLLKYLVSRISKLTQKEFNSLMSAVLFLISLFFIGLTAFILLGLVSGSIRPQEVIGGTVVASIGIAFVTMLVAGMIKYDD